MQIKTIFAFIRLGRPLFLVGGLVYFALGSAMAASQGVMIRPAVYLWGQATITAGQWMTHYCNDYFDLPYDIPNQHRTPWSGGSGVLIEGQLPRRTALIAALVLGGMALGGGVVLEIGYHSGPLILPLIVSGLAASWFYSAPPLRLHTKGLGEITAAGVVSTLVPLIAFTLQGGGLASFPLPVCIPLFLLQMAAILTIQFPDFASDKQTNKQTLVVRLGGKWSARVIVGLIGAAYACLPLLRGAGSSPLVVGAAALSFPLGLWQWSRIIRKEWQQAERWATLGFWGFSLPLGMGLLMAVGYMMGAG